MIPAELQPYIPFLIPIIVIQLALLIFALVDVLRRERTRGPKWLWIVLIVAVNFIGPIAYFVIGRQDE